VNLGALTASSVADVFFDPIDGGPVTAEIVAWVTARNPNQTVDFFQVQLNPLLVTSGSSFSFTPSDRIANCSSACVYLQTGCNAMGCGALYLAQGGGMNVVTVGSDYHAGFLAGMGGTLHLVQWNEASDQPVPGGGCFEVPAFDYHGTYRYLGAQQWSFDAG
jgi:hypothetical protein